MEKEEGEKKIRNRFEKKKLANAHARKTKMLPSN